MFYRGGIISFMTFYDGYFMNGSNYFMCGFYEQTNYSLPLLPNFRLQILLNDVVTMPLEID